MDLRRAICLLLATVVSGCGGGGGGVGGSASPSTPDAGRPFGLWEGTTGDSRSIAGLVLPTSEYWFIYSAPGNTAVIAGVVEGDIDDNNGQFNSRNGKDFNFEGAGILDLWLEGSYTQKQTLKGTGDYQNSALTSSFTTRYNADWEITPTLSAIAGSYTGAAYAGFTEYAELVVTDKGVISGQSASGCSFSGTINPSNNGNFYSVSVNFKDAICANGITGLASYAYYSAATRTLYSVGLNTARDNGFIFVGTKP
jgi:hypothetical protein